MDKQRKLIETLNKLAWEEVSLCEICQKGFYL